MSNKPSLYVVEKKEVAVLVILFVLVTVLAFTLGVKYGESIGRKSFDQSQQARHEVNEELAGKGGQGTLGGEGDAHSAAPETAGDAHGEGHAEAGHEAKPAADAPGEAKGAHDSHGAKSAPVEHGDSPEALAHKADAPEVKPGLKERPKEAVDTNSDDHLLQALTQAGIDPPKAMGTKHGAKPAAQQESGLPSQTKVPPAGSFTIQVGSYPTKSDASAQLRKLKEDNLEAVIMSPVSDKSGEWHRVVVGSYKTKADAERAAKQAKERGSFKNYFVRKLN